MAHVQSHAPGSFCWLELGTTNQDAAKDFYFNLFGWKANDHPMGEMGVYTMFELEGRPAAAGYTLSPQMRDAGVPPHWMLYIATANTDETAVKVVEAGGKVEMAPLDVYDYGRMAVIHDPAGAPFAVWQAKSHPGTGIEGITGTICWADLSTPDPEQAAKFYKHVFGWELDPGQDGSGYLHIKNGQTYIGGVPPVQYRSPHVPPHWLAYFLVNNCDESANQAKALGATLHMPPTTMEKVGRWAVVADPQGAVFALFQPLPHS
jgi:uncharacterized protein